MKTIIVEPIVHDAEQRLKLIFDYDDLLISKVKELPGSRWSRTM